jgi:hypothetical protein
MTDPDFESFLASESARQQEADLASKIREQINTALFGNLNDLSIPILLDPIDEEEARRKAIFVEEILPDIRAELLKQDPEAELSPNFDEYLAQLVEHAYHQRFWDEKVLFELVSSTLLHVERARLDGYDYDYSDQKKRRIAEVMIMHNFSLDDPLMNWANNVLPGERFDPSKDEDAQHFADAMESYLKQQAGINVMHEAMSDGYALAGVGLHEDEDTDRELYERLQRSRDAVAEIVGAAWMAQQTIENLGIERAKAKRDEEIDAYIRANETGLSTEIIAELYSMIEDRFPLGD